MSGAYENFDLLIDAGTHGYRARVLRSLAGDAATTFELPFSHDELAAFYELTLGIPGVEDAPAAGESPPLGIQAFGSRLYQAVFAGPVGSCLLRSLDEAYRRQVGLRIRLRVDGSLAELGELPWEYLYVPELARFLALSDQTPLVRYLETVQGVQPLRNQPPLAVVAALASPSDLEPLSVDQEWSRLQLALAQLQQAGLIRLERLPAGTLDALQTRLRQAPLHVLHFVGHGHFDADQGQGGVVFEAETGAGELVMAETLGMVLHDHPALRLVFLNACEGARGGRSDPFAGVAQRLVQQGIPAVVAMQFPVSDQAAVAMSSTFYHALANGLPADTALSAARKNIAALGNSLEWGTPVLFSRSDDNRLIELPEGDARLDIELHHRDEPVTVLIAAGPFLMGNDDPNAQSVERPSATIDLPAFRIARCPVTNRQYAAFLRDDPRPEPKRAGWRLRQPPADKLDHPVVNVSWDDAQTYCRWLSRITGRQYRLPTEAEWEKAASWIAPTYAQPEGQRLRYPWGDDWGDGLCNVAADDTTPVTTFPGGASPYGCLDMLGNVEEWTSTLWGGDLARSDFPYPYRPDDGREAIAPSPGRFRTYRIVRGGSFTSQPGDVSCAARDRTDQGDSGCRWRGFRVVLQLNGVTAKP